MTAPAQTTVTRAELADLVRPFVNRKLHPEHRADGHILPQLERISIARPGSVFVDASVRSVDADGVSVFFYSGLDFTPWSEVQWVEIYGVDPERELPTWRKVFVPSRTAEELAA